MRTATSDRRGFAMAFAIFAIVIIGILVAGVFFASTQDFRVGRNTLIQERALTAAEFGQNRVLMRWIRDSATRMPVGDTMFFVDTSSAGALDTVRVTKTNRTTFWVVSEGRAEGGVDLGARRRTGMVITLDVPQIRVPAAFTGRGRDTIGGSSITSGRDSMPPGWDCPPPGAPTAAISTPDSQMIYQGNQYSLQGSSPQVDREPLAADTNTYFNITGTGWPGLTAMATKVYDNTAGVLLNQIGPRVAGTTCLTGDMNNWGDPARNLVTPGPCETYMPIIHSRGPGVLRLQGGGAGGGGQGMLLVDGDLEMSGNFQFKGLIIVRGRFRVSGTGVRVQGGVMAANVNGGANTIIGNSQLIFSRCALTTVMAVHSWPKPARERSWADMF
jgi:hypothetical protein